LWYQYNPPIPSYLFSASPTDRLGFDQTTRDTNTAPFAPRFLASSFHIPSPTVTHDSFAIWDTDSYQLFAIWDTDSYQYQYTNIMPVFANRGDSHPSRNSYLLRARGDAHLRAKMCFANSRRTHRSNAVRVAKTGQMCHHIEYARRSILGPTLPAASWRRRTGPTRVWCGLVTAQECRADVS
jgi:hypothetical protein